MTTTDKVTDSLIKEHDELLGNARKAINQLNNKKNTLTDSDKLEIEELIGQLQDIKSKNT